MRHKDTDLNNDSLSSVLNTTLIAYIHLQTDFNNNALCVCVLFAVCLCDGLKMLDFIHFNRFWAQPNIVTLQINHNLQLYSIFVAAAASCVFVVGCVASLSHNAQLLLLTAVAVAGLTVRF